MNITASIGATISIIAGLKRPSRRDLAVGRQMHIARRRFIAVADADQESALNRTARVVGTDLRAIPAIVKASL